MTTFAGDVQAYFTVPAGQSMSATSGGVGPTSVTITAGSYTPALFVAHVAARLVAVKGAGWTATLSTGSSGTGKVSITFTGSTYSLAWTTTDTRDVLGFTTDLTSVGSGVASVGTYAARGLWQPDVPLISDVDIKQAPTVDDGRTVVGPTGVSVMLVGCDKYQHTNLQWPNVSLNRVWISEETTTNQSYERFYLDAIRGNGHSWFTPGSALVITDHRGSVAGVAHSIASWKAIDVPKLATLRMSVANWTGQWTIQWPKIETDA